MVHFVMMMPFVLEATKSDHSVVRMLSDDTDVHVLLVYWVNTRYRGRVRVDQYLTSPVLVLVRHTCSYQVCIPYSQRL